MLVDIDDVLSDASRAGGFASVVFGPDSPAVKGEEDFMNVEDWREIKMDFSGVQGEEDKMREQEQQQQQQPVVSAYDSEQGFKEISAHELRARIEASSSTDTAEQMPIVIDVRSAEEFATGSIVSSAVNVPIESLSAQARDGRLDAYRGKFIVMVCGSGLRSAQATVRLSKLFAFDRVHNLTGGIAAAGTVFGVGALKGVDITSDDDEQRN